MIPRLSFLLCFIVFLQSTINATAYTWNGGSGVWGDPLMWSPNGVPGPGDNATMNGGACTLDADLEIASLTITNGSISGDFDITVPGNVSVSGSALVNNDGDLNIGGALNWISGTFGDGITGGSITITGLTTLSQVFTKTLKRKTMVFNGNLLFNHGGILLADGAILHIPVGTTFTAVGSAITGSAGLVNTIQNDGTLLKAGGVPLTLQGPLNLVNAGTVQATGTISFFGAQTTFSNAGTVSPGNAPGVLTMNKFTNGGSTLKIQIAGTGSAGAPNGFDQLNITGSPAGLGGILEIHLINGFIPVSGQSYIIANMPLGYTPTTFSQINSYGLPPGFDWNIIYGPNRITIVYCELDTWYADIDMDGYGNPNSTVLACNHPVGYVSGSTDCNDENAAFHPGAPELCDGFDNNCDGVVPSNEIDNDEDGVSECAGDSCPDDPEKTAPGICGCGVSDVDTDGDGTADCLDACPDDPEKTAPGICGCGVSDVDTDGDGTADCNDACPDDPDKAAPGICGCGVSDADTDGDGTADCNDACPNDPEKTTPGICGCGVSDTDSDSDGVPDCNDECPEDPDKTQPGICGCGESDVDSDSDGVPDCIDECPEDPDKTQSGICGCEESDVDTDGDGVADCHDGCPEDPLKTDPGLCGCGVSDVDTDGDGAADCHDGCPEDPLKIQPGICGCGESDADSDSDGAADCNDECPEDPDKTQPGICGCGESDVDSDSDGVADCIDACPEDSNKTQPGICGCGESDADSDGDGVADCNDACPDDSEKVEPGICGCGVSDVDTDGDGTADCNDECPADPASTVPSVWYTDLDGDGYGTGTPFLACGLPANASQLNGDCRDDDPLIYPTQIEVCNDVDDDCDGLIDDEDPDIDNQLIWYLDSDGDGYGDPAHSVYACYQPSDYVGNNEDCNDEDALISPRGTEICNSQDDNCDGVNDEGLECGGDDYDNDGVADDVDNCPDVSNPDQADTDCDGVGNGCDVCHGGDDTVDNNNDGRPDCRYPPAYAQIVPEWKCGSKKVYICHGDPGSSGVAHTLCINYNAIGAHMAHDDYLGPCGNASCGGSSPLTEDTDMFEGFENPGQEHAIVPAHDEDTWRAWVESQEMIVRPNPTTDITTVILPHIQGDGIFTMYTITGHVRYTQRLAGVQEIEVDMSVHPAGIYFFDVMTAEGLWQKKVIRVE